MKSINIRKVAAVAAGTALLAGAAFAASGVTNDFLVDDNGNCNVQIVVGEDAAVSDGIAAGNLAAAIGAKCYVETSGGEEVTVAGADIGATGSVTVQTGSTTVTGSGDTLEIKPYSNQEAIYVGNNNAIWTLTKSNAPFLKSGKLTFTSGTDYSYQEIIGLGNSGSGFKVKYREDKDQHGVLLTASSGDAIDYYVNFDTAAPDQSSISGAPELYFLGTKYIVNKWDIGGGKITLIKGVEARLGVGQSTDVTVGDDVYTVTLDDASLDETSSTGEATVTLTKGGVSSDPINLDTSSDPDETWEDFYVYLQSVAKSYTPGQGGTATLRVGGEKAELVDGAEYELDETYKVSFTKTGTNNDELQKLHLQLDDAIDMNDDQTTIVGPDGYFEIQYTGTSSETTDEITFKTSSYRINKIVYPDKEGTVTEVNVQDSNDKIETYFAENNGTANSTLIIRSSKYFISDDEVIKFQSFDADADTSYTTSSVSVTLKPYGEDASTFYPNNIRSNAVACFNDKVVAGRTIDFMMAIRNDTVDATFYNQVNDSTCAVFSGTNPVYHVYPDIKKGHIAVDTDNDDLIDGVAALNTNVLANISITPVAYGRGSSTNGAHEFTAGINQNVTVWEPSGTGFGRLIVTGLNVSSNEGMWVNYSRTATGPISDGFLTTASGTNAGDDNKAYGMTNWGTEVYSTTSETVLKIPKNALKYNLFAGQPAGTTLEGQSIYTPDNFADPVTAFTCEANDYAYTASAGVDFGTWASPVVNDKGIPSGNAIVIGGHIVNKLAVGVTESKLTKAGDKYCELVDNTLYCAGYLASDTTSAVNGLVAEIKAL
jgi:hypothetical protein